MSTEIRYIRHADRLMENLRSYITNTTIMMRASANKTGNEISLMSSVGDLRRAHYFSKAVGLDLLREILDHTEKRQRDGKVIDPFDVVSGFSEIIIQRIRESADSSASALQQAGTNSGFHEVMADVSRIATDFVVSLGESGNSPVPLDERNEFRELLEPLGVHLDHMSFTSDSEPEQP